MPHFMVDTKLYGWDIPEQALRREKNILLLLSLLNVALSIACGVIPTGVTRHNWVSFAATAALIALMMSVIGAARFRAAKALLDKRAFDSIHSMMRWSAQCHMALMAVAFTAGVVSCFQSFGGILDLVILLGFVLSFACSFLLLRRYDGIPTHNIKAPE